VKDEWWKWTQVVADIVWLLAEVKHEVLWEIFGYTGHGLHDSFMQLRQTEYSTSASAVSNTG